MSETATAPERRVRPAYLAVALVWCLAALAVKPFYPFLDFAVFYSTALDFILTGRPLDMYSWVAYPPNSDLPIPVNHAPLWFFWLAPFYAAGQWIGLDDFKVSSGFSLGQAWMLLASLPFDLLLAGLVVRLVERTRGALPEPRRLLLFASVLCTPLLWLASVRFGHNESLMVAMTLLAVHEGEKRRPLTAGLCWGLAVSLKATALVPALVWFGWTLGSRRWRSLLAAGAVAAAACLIPLAPFLLMRREQILYALAGYERTRPLGGYVLWKLADLPAFLPELSVPLMFIAALGTGLLLARRGSGEFLASGGAAALVLGQVLFLLFAKSIFMWYALALGVYAFIAFPPASDRGRSLPLLAIGLNLALWGFHGGNWAAEHVSPAIRLWTALWVAFLIALGAAALRRMRPAPA